jgi:two-component system copper resistance phosphate regulon response regulator CusR
VKILIVEDEPKTGEYLRQGLNEAGFVADLAANGSDGLHLALHGEYDLVILDVMLPETGRLAGAGKNCGGAGRRRRSCF